MSNNVLINLVQNIPTFCYSTNKTNMKNMNNRVTKSIQHCLWTTMHSVNDNNLIDTGKLNIEPILERRDGRRSIGGTSHKDCMTLDYSEFSSDQLNFIDLLPHPFRLLDLRKAKSSTGKCWIFYMSDNGFMRGCLFPGGYRLYGLKNGLQDINGTFFIECRNFQKNIRRVLSARVRKNQKVGIHNATLTLTNGITISTTPKVYVMNYHSWKAGMKFKMYQQDEKNNLTFEK